jgi:crotonobetainyl-CoA:carnitine CoA-transferase CaiB-like acyl-CoA transferase
MGDNNKQPSKGVKVLELGSLIQHRGTLTDVQHPTLGKLPLPGVNVRLSDTPASTRLAPPKLWNSNDEVYRQIVGLSAEKVTGPRDREVI